MPGGSYRPGWRSRDRRIEIEPTLRPERTAASAIGEAITISSSAAVHRRYATDRALVPGDKEIRTEGVECREDEGVVDEIPGAYEDLETVMALQTDLVDVRHLLRTVLCVKG